MIGVRLTPLLPPAFQTPQPHTHSHVLEDVFD